MLRLSSEHTSPPPITPTPAYYLPLSLYILVRARGRSQILSVKAIDKQPTASNWYHSRQDGCGINGLQVVSTQPTGVKRQEALCDLKNCVALDQSSQLHAHTTSHVGPIYESLHESAVAVPRPGVKHYDTYNGQSINTPSTTRVGYLQTPPTMTTRSVHSCALATPATAFMVTPASALTIIPVSPIRSHFGILMAHA
ncbi:hypothetical protein RhiJN_24816 [Ceratobasidium sp. AG-Ba]|nr:hypothetical protein RhiJN_24816 [Ceratobasidium sp. AG-Ba]